jgi:predicted nucleic acid-binding protein
MILLDTNVLSAMMQLVPDPAVADWLDRQPPESIWTTTISIMEISAGLKMMPDGHRRNALWNAFVILLREKIEGRIAPFDLPAAEKASDLIALRKGKGRPVETRDTMIAGIAEASRATLATRNTAHFYDLSVPVVNPWGTQKTIPSF